jgi:hypothetical protein
MLDGNVERAKARWTEASAVVDADKLVAPRIDRAATRQSAGVAKLSAGLDALRADFEKLFSDVLAGSEGVSFEIRDITDHVGHLGNDEARNKLTLAVNAAQRCVDIVRSRRHDSAEPFDSPGAVWRPTPPVAPSPDTLRQAPWRRDAYERDLATYRAEMDRATEQEDNRAMKRSTHIADLTAKIESTMAEARALSDQGLLLANSALQATQGP